MYSYGGHMPQARPAAPQNFRPPPAAAASRALAIKGMGPAGKAPSQASPPPTGDRYTALTMAADTNEFVIQTLCGDFIEKGVNHERKYFQKMPPGPGQPSPEVFLYYWDSRDGPSYEGWWFGKSVGGNEVWSHNQTSSENPPAKGWKIPFAGAKRDTFELQSRVEEDRVARDAVMELTTGADKALADAQAAIQQAKTAAGDYLSMDSITAAEEIVAPQLQKLEELSANLTRSVHQNPQARIHIPKVGNAVSMMKMEVQKLRLAKPKAAAAQKLRESEQKDAAALEEALAELKAVMDNAEDMVEKTAITMSLVEQAGDNADETAEAITATEAHAKESSQVLKEATAALATKTAQVVKTLTLPKVKLQANQELDKLRQKLKLAQQKLLPMLNIKQTFKLKAAAEQLMSQVEEQLTSADMQVDEAEKICEALQGDDPGNDVIKEAERAVAGAVDMLNGTARTLEARRAQAGTNPYLKTEQAEERIRGGHKRLEGLRAILKRKQEKQASANLLNDVAEKMQALQDALARALELLGPYLFESAVRSLDETLEDIRNGEKEMIAASKAASAARITISMKQIDVKRFVGESGQEAQRLLKLRQEELEAALKKIEEVKAGMATCKEAALKVEVSTRVEEAEALVLKVEAAMDLVSDESKLEGLSETEIRERGGAAADLKAACDKACKLAQDLVTKRQIDAKARPSADAEEVAELQKFQARVRLATAEASKYKALPAAVQAQLAVKKVIDEAASKVIAAEEKKDKAEKAVRAVLDAVESQEEAPEGLGKAPGRGGEKVGDQAQTEVTSAVMACKSAATHLQVQKAKLPQDELAKLQARVKEAQQSLAEAEASLKSSSERIVARGLLEETDQRVRDAEAAVQKAANIAGFLPEQALDDEEQPAAEDGAMADFNDAIGVANKLLGGAKTFLAVKKIAAKRFSEASSKRCQDELAVMQSRVEACVQRVMEVRAKAAGRKFAKVKKEAEDKFKEAQEKIDAYREASDPLLDEEALKGMSATDLKESLIRVHGPSGAAQAAFSAAREHVDFQVNEAKKGPDGAVVLHEFKGLLGEIAEAQKFLDSRAKQILEMEQKFVGRCLLSEADEMFDALEAKLAQAKAATDPLIGDSKEDFTASLSLDAIMDTLREKVEKSSATPGALFEEMGGEDGAISEEKFVASLKGMAELRERPGAPTSDAQLKAAFRRLRKAGAEASEPVEQSAFVDHFVDRYLTLGIVPVSQEAEEGSAAVCELPALEVVEALAAPSKSEAGAAWLEIKATPDGMPVQGHVVFSNADGSSQFERYTAYTACVRRSEAALSEALEAVNATQTFLKRRSEEIKVHKVTSGPLVEVKAQLMKMRVRASKAQTSHSNMKTKMEAATKEIEKELREEKRRRQEAAAKAEAAAMTQEATEAVESVAAEVEKAAVAAEEAAKSKGKGPDDALAALEQSEKDVEAALASLVGVQQRLAKMSGQVASSTSAPLAELRRLLSKLKAKLGSCEPRCKKQIDALQGARSLLAGDARAAIAAALRAAVEKDAASPGGLFRRMCPSGDEVPVEDLKKFLEGLEGVGIQPAQLDLGLRSLSAGVSRLGLAQLLSDHRRCVKEVSLTDGLEVKGTTTVRKLESGEYLEVLEGEQKDETSGLARVKCRALRDSVEGYCTIRSHQGTEFVRLARKPYVLCEAATTLEEACEAGSAQVRPVLPGELLEVQEGPRRAPPTEVTRVKGKAARDGKIGWVTLRESPQASASLELAKKLICRGSIAITDAFDIGASKAIRKLEVGEEVEALEDPREDEKRKLRRIKLRAASDGKEGWVTMKGNQGTVYVMESTSHYACVRATAIETSFAAGGQVVRMLEEGELFEVSETKPQTLEGALRARGRIVPTGDDGSGGDSGWISVDSHVSIWCTTHRCKRGTDLTDESGEVVVRPLVVGEVLEALQVPFRDEAAGILRVRLRAEKDGAVGFAALKDADGGVLLEPAA